ncbi:MAG: cytochrome b/b6 domain-containing protein [Rhizobiaceae bacterium]
MDAVIVAGSEPAPGTGRVRVWDPFVRLFHWSLVALFAFAFLTGDEWDAAHETAGLVIAALVAARIVWGFIGTQHARFASFVRGPRTVLAFLAATARLRAPRHLGHNPAGGAMMIALLAMIAGIAGTGYMMTTDAWFGVEWLEDAHEALAYATLGLVALHVVGVIIASLEHRENLVAAMISGFKRAR